MPINHSLQLVDPELIHIPSLCISPRHNDIFRKELDKIMDAGVITQMISAWVFPLVLATKNDLKPGFCADYHAVNRKMKADRWPLLKIKEIFDDLKRSLVFSTLDGFMGIGKYRICDKFKEKMIFDCHFGTFRF